MDKQKKNNSKSGKNLQNLLSPMSTLPSFDSFSDEESFNSASIATAKRYDTKEEVSEISGAIRSRIKAVRLSGNTYSEEACESIASRLRECADLVYADCSDMFTTRLKTVVPPALGFLCDSFEILPIESLDVSDNALGGPGTAQVTKLIPRPSFKCLRINNCGIGTAGALLLSNTFRNLAGVASVNAEDAKHEDLKEILVDTPTEPFTTEIRCEIPLEILVAGRNRLKVDGAEALSYGLPFLVNLREIHLASNSIPTEGTVAICNALRKCNKLELLDLNDNSLKDGGVQPLIDLLGALPTLRVLKVGDCLEEEDSMALLNALKEKMPLLECLDMTYDEIPDEGAEIIIEIIESRPTLSSLELNGNCFSKDIVKRLHKTLSNHAHPDALGSLSDNEDEDSEEDEDEDEDVDELAGQMDHLQVK